MSEQRTPGDEKAGTPQPDQPTRTPASRPLSSYGRRDVRTTVARLRNL